jgi:hypothetical protein
MTTSIEPAPAPALPSKRKLAQTTAIALAAATVILVAVVLPAEYGVDPLGTGRALGLTRMAAPPPIEEGPPSGGGQVLAPVQNGPIGVYPADYKIDSARFVLGPYEFVEYKYHLEQGATMLYAWKGTAAVLHDFHGEKDGARGEAISFEKKSRVQGTGVFTAPFTGIHGWYWENPGADTITVSLESAGFYSSAIELRSDRSRYPHELTTPGGMAPPGIK